MLVFTQIYLWFLCILVVYDTFLSLDISIATFICTLLRCLLSDRYSNLFSKVTILSLLILSMVICSLLLLSIINVLQIVWHNQPYQWKVSPFWLTIAIGFLYLLTKPILFICQCKGFCVIIYLDNILVLIYSMCAGRLA